MLGEAADLGVAEEQAADDVVPSGPTGTAR